MNRLDRQTLNAIYLGVGSLAFDPLPMLKMVLYQYLKKHASPAQWYEALRQSRMISSSGATAARLIHHPLDDAVGAIPVHVGAGVWGTIAVGLFADPQSLATGLSRTGQVSIQLLGVVVAGALSLGGAYVLLRVLSCFLSLRVTAEQEDMGLNISEHGATTEAFELLSQMESHRLSGDVSTRVPGDPGTELGRISAQYNRVLERLEAKQDYLKAANHQLQESSLQIQPSQARLTAILDSTVEPMIAISARGIVRICSRSRARRLWLAS
ncbi:MAG: hypothetical protein ABI614_12430 [Planctomycetota bacterium]